jgi:hypothetical protein
VSVFTPYTYTILFVNYSSVKLDSVILSLYDHVEYKYKNNIKARHQWLRPVILANQEAEIRRIMVESQPRQIVCETVS